MNRSVKVGEDQHWQMPVALALHKCDEQDA